MAEQSRDSYWMSYSDLATCLLLVFVLIIVAILHTYQVELDSIFGVREELINALKSEFGEDELEFDIDGKTGDLVLPSKLLFDFDSVELSLQGEDFLDEFMPRYLDVVLDTSHQQHIAEVIVEGHADTVGSYLTNLSRSHGRAQAVLKHMLTIDYPDTTMGRRLRVKAAASGRSESEPVCTSDGEVDCAASRRVVFKFRLRDEEMINKARGILRSDEADLETPERPSVPS